ncbi:MAG: VCBS repeat-containing protein [Propionibacteriaceae bacterium]|nr:VCBS repeat-containing protein [Propionibacteriaceae bacterium]
MRNIPAALLTLCVAVGALALPVLPAVAAPAPCFDAGELDFNGDGYADAAVGDPDATVSGQTGAGQVVILYGDADGRIGEGARAVLTQASLGSAPEAGDRFGAALAVARVDMDSCLDLVVGSPGETLSGAAAAGVAFVVFGSKDGINAGATSQLLSQADVGGAVEAGDRFASAVAAGDNLGTDTSMVVFGAPGEDLGSATDAGVVNYLQYSDTIPVLPRQISQNTAGIPGSAETGDLFGAAVALGVDLIDDLDVWEIVVGAPGESLGARERAGSITVISDVHTFPPTTYPAVSYTQDSPAVPGSSEEGDLFGYSLAVLNTPAKRTLAVGAPGESIGPTASAGVVNLFTSTGSGLVPGVGLHQDSPGVGGAAEAGDRFGHALSFVPARPGETTAALAVGIPLEDLGSVKDAGMVQVFPLNNLDAETSYHQDSPGAVGSVHTGGRFGSPVISLEADQETVLAVGNPYEGVGSVYLLSYGDVGYSPRAWTPGAGGVPAAGAARFGWSVGAN